MKFSCEKALLLQAINIASRTVAVKSSITALEGILIEARQQLTITGYNMETGIRTLVEADIMESGSLVLSARLFGDIVRRLPDDIVHFQSNHFMVNITCGSSEFNILGIDAEEFPELPEVESGNRVVIEQKKLKSMIAQTLFSVSTNTAKPVHTGSLFEISEENTLTMVAVDGFRLALRKEEVLSKEGIPSFSYVVPGAALSEVEKICADSEDPVEFIQGGKHICFKVGTTVLISRRLEGEFLNYRKSIPWKNPIKVTVNRKALMSAVDRVSLIISEKQKSPLHCVLTDQLMTIKTTTAIGNAYDECVMAGDGKGLEIGFNNRFMMDALRAAPAEELCLQLNTAISPCLIVPADGSDHFLYMVLPVRIKATN